MDNLKSLCCLKIATYIYGKSVEEVRKAFKIVNDFTPEEEAIPFNKLEYMKHAEEQEAES
jgi:hypothetical protein